MTTHYGPICAYRGAMFKTQRDTDNKLDRKARGVRLKPFTGRGTRGALAKQYMEAAREERIALGLPLTPRPRMFRGLCAGVSHHTIHLAKTATDVKAANRKRLMAAVIKKTADARKRALDDGKRSSRRHKNDGPSL